MLKWTSERALAITEKSSKYLIFHERHNTYSGSGGVNGHDIVVIAVLFSIVASLLAIYKVKQMEKKYNIS